MSLNSDLEDARNKVTFSVEEFTNWYHGGAEKVKEKRLLGKIEMIPLEIYSWES